MEVSTDASSRQVSSRKTTILVGDALHSLPTLHHQSIHSIVTSPPYWGLRDYGVEPSEWPEIAYQPMPGLPVITIAPMTCCLGLECTPEAFVGHLLHVFRLAREALREDGTCFVNLGDSYAGNGTAYDDTSSTLVGSKQSGRVGGKRPSKEGSGLKAKDLVGIPWRFAFAMQADGWYLRSDVIWSKANPMPESVTDRPTRAHEYVFIFAKSERYYADMAGVKEPAVYGNHPRTILNNGSKVVPPGASPHRGLRRDTSKEDGRNLRSVWQSASTPFAAKNIGITDADHYAVMAEPIVDKCIRIGCPKGGTILDPFGGAGTTGLLASRLERNAVLCEINPDSARIAKARIEAEDSLFYRVEVVG